MIKKKRSLVPYKSGIPVRPPVSSVSKNIQERHVRVYHKPGKPAKAVLINKGRQRLQRIIHRPETVFKQNVPVISLRPRTPEGEGWKKVLKIDKGDNDLDRAARLEKDMSLKGIKLYPGERVADQVLEFHQEFMATMGDVVLRDAITGEEVVVPLETRMSGASLIEFLLDKKETGGKVIYKMSDDGVFDMLDYTRDYEPERNDFSSDQAMVELQPLHQKKNDESIRAIKTMSDGSKKQKFFESMESFNKAEKIANKEGLDAFGDRLNTQASINEFEGVKPVYNESFISVNVADMTKIPNLITGELLKNFSKRGIIMGKKNVDDSWLKMSGKKVDIDFIKDLLKKKGVRVK